MEEIDTAERMNDEVSGSFTAMVGDRRRPCYGEGTSGKEEWKGKVSRRG